MCDTVAVGGRNQKVFRAHVFILQPLRLLLRPFEELAKPRGEIGLYQALNLRQPVQSLFYVPFDTAGVGSEFLQQGQHYAVRLFQKREKKMFHFDILIMAFRGYFLGRLQGLCRF